MVSVSRVPGVSPVCPGHTPTECVPCPPSIGDTVTLDGSGHAELFSVSRVNERTTR